MNVLSLNPLWTRCCDAIAVPLTAQNPTMTYSSTLGTPTEQGITPPYPNLPASIYDSDGVSTTYGWNPVTAAWV